MEEGWVVFWDWANEAAALRDHFVFVLPATTSVEEVMRFVEAIAAIHSYTADEILTMASSDWNPYRAELSANDRITCGHNPWLEAKRVRNIRVETDEKTRLETILWIEKRADGKEYDNGIRRTKQGTLSFEGTWDRANNKPKTFND